MSLLSGLLPALRQTAAILSLRLLPFAVYMLIRPRSTILQRSLWTIAYGCVVGIAYWLDALLTVVIILGAAVYYFVVSIGLSRLGSWLATGQLTRAGAFTVALFTCLLLPGVLLPGIGMTVFLVVGWDLTLSSYSLAVETSYPGAARPSLGEALFFLLLNPTVVYAVRGERVSDGGDFSGFGRAAMGGAVMFADIAIMGPLATYLRSRESTASSDVLGLLFAIGFGMARFFEVYGAHSGLASLQIGLMRLIGWRVPECYRYPAAARSPMDFWRRWNIYVRVWLEAYVFLPLARGIARKTRRRSGQVVAAIATLAASGLLHLAFVFAGRQALPSESLSPFLAAGALMALWSVVGVAAAVIRKRLDAQQVNRFDGAVRVMGRMGMFAALVSAAVVWG